MVLRRQLLNLSFKIPYAFLISIQNNMWESARAMFCSRYCEKVFNSIIVFYSVKMVNYPTIRQWFSIKIFPHFDMLHNISVFVCSVMSMAKNLNITVQVSFTTSPSGRLLSDCIFFVASSAHFAFTFLKHRLAAAWTQNKTLFMIPYLQAFLLTIITGFLIGYPGRKILTTDPTYSYSNGSQFASHNSYYTLGGLNIQV